MKIVRNFGALFLTLLILGEYSLLTEGGHGHHHSRRGHHRTHRKSHHNQRHRFRRNLTGHYHPELHGHDAQVHSHSSEDNSLGHGHVHSISSTSVNGEQHTHISSFVSAPQTQFQNEVTGHGPGYSYPAVPVPPGQGVDAPNCGCVQKDGGCASSQRSFTELVIATQSSELVCGTNFRICCWDDPWAGFVDAFSHMAPCRPTDQCRRHYGSEPTDVRDFGSIGPCPGLETVRCLDDKVPLAPIPVVIQPEGPTHFVVPILETPQPPIVYEPPVVYNPPTPITEPPTTPPPIIYHPPVPITEPPTTPPPIVYHPPVPITEPPTTQPPIVYNPPVPVPEPIPPISYGPPAVVEEPSTYYTAPEPEPVPVSVPVPPPTYGVPGVPHGRPLGYYGGGYGGFPYRGFIGGGYPGYGLGFRKHFSFSKGFGGIWG